MFSVGQCILDLHMESLRKSSCVNPACHVNWPNIPRLLDSKNVTHIGRTEVQSICQP